MDKVCIVCGEPLPHGRSKYCSTACAERIYQYHSPTNTRKNCVMCGKPSERGDFCSRKCELDRQREHFGGKTVKELLDDLRYYQRKGAI